MVPVMWELFGFRGCTVEFSVLVGCGASSPSD